MFTPVIFFHAAFAPTMPLARGSHVEFSFVFCFQTFRTSLHTIYRCGIIASCKDNSMAISSITFDLWRLIFDPAIVLAIAGAFWRQAYLRGYLKKQIEDLKEKVENLENRGVGIDEESSDTAVNFREMATKIDHLEAGQKEIKDSALKDIKDSVTEIRELFIRHLNHKEE